jgi:hypothetical protein
MPSAHDGMLRRDTRSVSFSIAMAPEVTELFIITVGREGSIGLNPHVTDMPVRGLHD